MIATGRDEEARGLTVNKQWALQQGKKNVDWREVKDDNGKVIGRQFASLAGEWIDEANVDKGHARWGKSPFAQQAALAYEMRKVNTEDQARRVASNYRIVSQGKDAAGNDVGGGWKSAGVVSRTLDDTEAMGIWVGSGFEHQNIHLEYKNIDWKTGELKKTVGSSVATGQNAEGVEVKGTLRGGSLATETFEKKGNSALSAMGSDTIVRLMDSWESADRVERGIGDDGKTQVFYTDSSGAQRPGYDPETVRLARKQKEELAASAEVFMSRYGSMAGAGGGIDMDALREQIQDEYRQEALLEMQQLGVTENSEQGQERLRQAREAASHTANSYGAGHVAQRVVQFAQLTGRYAGVPKAPDSPNPNTPPILPEN
jgi:hypothetical protein